MSSSVHSSQSQSRIPKPSGLKPPSYGSSSSLPKYSTLRQSSELPKENENSISSVRSPPPKSPFKAAHKSPQKSPVVTKSPRKVQDSQVYATRRPSSDRFDSLLSKVNSVPSTDSYQSTSMHSKFGSGASVMSLDSTRTKSTFGGGSSVTSSRLGSTSAMARVARKFDVSKTVSNLPQTTSSSRPASTSLMRSSGGLSSSRPPSATSRQTPSSTHSSPSSKSVRSATGSVRSVPNTPPRKDGFHKFSPTKSGNISSSSSVVSVSSVHSKTVTPDRSSTKRPTGRPVTPSSSSKPLASKPTPSKPLPAAMQQNNNNNNIAMNNNNNNESLAAITERIQEDMYYLDNYFAVHDNTTYNVFHLENDKRIQQFYQETRVIDGLPLEKYIQYVKGEDVLQEMFQGYEKQFGK
jgi:hypothetical protein